jgi:hypothetical protein
MAQLQSRGVRMDFSTSIRVGFCKKPLLGSGIGMRKPSHAGAYFCHTLKLL